MCFWYRRASGLLLLLLMLVHHLLLRHEPRVAVEMRMLLLLLRIARAVFVAGCCKCRCDVVQQSLNLGRRTRDAVSLRLHELDEGGHQSPW